MYVLKKTNHALATIVYMNCEEWEGMVHCLDDLSRVSDLILIYINPDKSLDCEKYSNLLGATGYYVGRQLSTSLSTVLPYCELIFTSYGGYVVTTLQNLRSVYSDSDSVHYCPNFTPEKIQSVFWSGYRDPFIVIERPSALVLRDLCKLKTVKIFGITVPHSSNKDDYYSTHYSTSPIILIPKYSAKIISDHLVNSDSSDYVRTFVSNDNDSVGRFLASTIKVLGIRYSSVKLQDIAHDEENNLFTKG